MFLWVYDLATGIFLHGGPYDAPFDPATQGRIRVARHPKPRTERYDGAGGMRRATAEEISDYDARQSTREENDRFETDKVLQALVVWLAGKQGMTVPDARAEIVAIYRQL